jgi:2-deoxy-D-gluconate 3-dehydrogenase
MKPVAIITGGSRGIGQAIAIDLARDYLVVIVAKSSGITWSGDICRYMQADLSVYGQALSVVGVVVEKYKRVDVLVNCAGVQQILPAEQVTRTDWGDIMDTNLRAPFVLSQQAALWMKANGGGKIINITSISASRAARNIAPYVASKAGLTMLTQALACEWAKDNIQVNAIAPGFIETDMFQARPELLERIPAGRFGHVTDIVGAVRYLLGADYVNGTTITVDGGWSAKN